MTQLVPPEPSKKWTTSASVGSESLLRLPRQHLEVSEAGVATEAREAAALPPATNATAAIAPAIGLGTAPTSAVDVETAVIVSETKVDASSVESVATSSATAVVVVTEGDAAAPAAAMHPEAVATTRTIHAGATAVTTVVEIIDEAQAVAEATHHTIKDVVEGEVTWWIAEVHATKVVHQPVLTEVPARGTVATAVVTDHHLIAGAQHAATATPTTLAMGHEAQIVNEDQDPETQDQTRAHLDAALPTSSVVHLRSKPVPQTEILKHRIASSRQPLMAKPRAKLAMTTRATLMQMHSSQPQKNKNR